jgi:hypothetical protein
MLTIDNLYAQCGISLQLNNSKYKLKIKENVVMYDH